ncbi:hypothetical protein [Caloramator sp. E03]|uniref:hypothetical protein n=1 Tax=Caloramator sp. E03 TaxID=2576307 RepID=UPI00143DB5A2|nr:hypothetical protein [Caloramator sp. E03]
MKTNNKKQLILYGKFEEVINFLKDSQKKYIYVLELIQALEDEKSTLKYIN